tara:strand:+ start:385 stop:684 length:300 start_codon:yes stop_codon:yes gene_type:complete
MNEKNIRIIGLVLGLILFFLLFCVSYDDATDLHFVIDWELSVIKSIGHELFKHHEIVNHGDDYWRAVYFWRSAIPVYCFLIWRYRTLIGRAVIVFIKKI